jgi:hypothetical protein
MVTIGIKWHTADRHIIDYDPDTGINAGQGDAGRGVKGNVVLIAALHAVDLNICVAEPAPAGAATGNTGVIVTQAKGTGRARRGTETDHPVVVIVAVGALR